MDKQNAHRGGGRKAGGKNISSYPNDTTNRPHFQPLLQQAARRMETDPGRYGAHYLIWLSLTAAKNGTEWEAR